MGPLTNSRYEKFAQMVASGLTGSEAYRQVAGATAGKNADVLAARWMDSPGVRERLNELKEANSRKATLTREKLIDFLCEVITASAANVEADSSLVQSAEFVGGKAVKLRIPDKIAAVKELVRVCGWAKPDRVELSATDTLAEFINSIRKRRGRDSTSWITRKTTGSDAKLWAHTSHCGKPPTQRKWWICRRFNIWKFRTLGINRSQAGLLWSPVENLETNKD
jgi:hypothetical protein